MQSVLLGAFCHGSALSLSLAPALSLPSSTLAPFSAVAFASAALGLALAYLLARALLARLRGRHGAAWGRAVLYVLPALVLPAAVSPLSAVLTSSVLLPLTIAADAAVKVSRGGSSGASGSGTDYNHRTSRLEDDVHLCVFVCACVWL